jgi:hypothetical protein
LAPAPKPRGKASAPPPEAEAPPADPTAIADYLARRKAEEKAAAIAYARGSDT